MWSVRGKEVYSFFPLNLASMFGKQKLLKTVRWFATCLLLSIAVLFLFYPMLLNWDAGQFGPTISCSNLALSKPARNSLTTQHARPIQQTYHGAIRATWRIGGFASLRFDFLSFHGPRQRPELLQFGVSFDHFPFLFLQFSAAGKGSFSLPPRYQVAEP